MKRAVGLVLLAACAVWGVLLIDPRGGRDRSKSRSSAKKAQSSADHAAQDPASSTSAARPSSKSQLESPTGVELKPAHRPSATGPAQPNSTGQGDVRVLGAPFNKPVAIAAQATVKPANMQAEPPQRTGELGEGVLSPDFVELEGDYIQEPREGPWALEHERKLRNFLYASDVGDHIVLVHCQSSVCRIHLEPHGDDPFGDLLRVPGLAEYANIDTSTPYSLNSSELIVYSRPKEPIAAPNPRETVK